MAISNDIIVEPNQDFRSRLQLVTFEEQVIVQPPETTVVILDDDSAFFENCMCNGRFPIPVAFLATVNTL